MVKNKIVIIEDDESLVKIIQEALDHDKYDLTLLLPSDEAIRKITDLEPSVIVLDIMLPGESGFDFLERLKKDVNTKDIPVVILSNLGQDEEIKRGLELGAIDYIVKADFSIYEIVHKITKAMNKKDGN